MTGADDRRALDTAVRENVAWCALVSALHGVSGSTVDGVWSTSRRAPRLYPDAITVAADATAVRARADAGSGCCVKDSYASLDLRDAGFTVLFESAWLHLSAPAAGSTGRWSVVDAAEFPSWERDCFGVTGILPAALLAEPSVRILGVAGESGFEAGAVAHRGDEVVGLSNVFGEIDTPLLSLIATTWPGLDLVGYERGPQLRRLCELGFDALGPLRVWLR